MSTRGRAIRRISGSTRLRKLRVDLLVDGCVVVECKALDEEKVNMERHKRGRPRSTVLMQDVEFNADASHTQRFGEFRCGYDARAFW